MRRTRLVHRVTTIRRTTFALLLAISTTGCLHFPTAATTTAIGWKNKPASVIPSEIAVLASPMPLEDDKRNTHQGVFCRVYFFARNNPTPITVAGEIVTIAYDAKSGSPQTPDAVFRVPSNKLPKHRRDDVVGDCYAFWFPYHVAQPADVILQSTLKLTDGRQITGEAVRLRLEPIDSNPTAGAEPPQTSK